MFQGVAMAAKGQMGIPNPRWTTRLTQHGEPVTCSDLAVGCCCIPCASAAAKSIADKSNPLFNFCCFTPCGTYSWVRHQYGIEGVCGDDLAHSVLCSCCTSRQVFTEARMRGPAPGTSSYGANAGNWAHSLFDCGFCDFFRICFCLPCVAHEIRVGLQPAADSCCFDMLCISPCSYYGQVRHSYGIVTDFPIVEDLCLPVVCFLCAFNRAHKQVKVMPLNGPTNTGGASFLPAPGMGGGYGNF